MSQDSKKQKNPVKFRKMTGDLIGVTVLAVGVAAVIGVGYLAYARFGGGEQEQSDIAASEQQSEQQDAEPNEKVAAVRKSGKESTAPESLPSKRKLATPKEKELTGSWQADFGSTKAFLQMSDGAFQLIYVTNDSGSLRKYARGRYTYDADQGALVLLPKRSSGKPVPVKGVRYKILTMRDYAILVFREKRSGALYWKPGSLEERDDHIHPLFFLTDREEATIKWKKSR